jgi:hypothetical protein
MMRRAAHNETLYMCGGMPLDHFGERHLLIDGAHNAD